MNTWSCRPGPTCSPKGGDVSGSAWASSDLSDVRPYTITGGRTRARHQLHLTTCLITRPAVAVAAPPGPESEALLLHCSGAPRSVAELAALLRQPVQVVKVLIGDLLDTDALALASGSATPGRQTLERLLDGLRNL